MAGEDAQEAGREGVQRAKRWLEMSTRVRDAWTHQDRSVGELLAFNWPHGSKESFTFDLGGRLRGDSLDNKSFVAEIKNYRKENDLPTHFRDFLAKCYVALSEHESRCDYFFWISWSPFQAKNWDQHATAETVEKSILHINNRERTLGVVDEAEARARLSAELLTRVADRIWLITLCDGQEQLVISRTHFLEVVKLITAERTFGT